MLEFFTNYVGSIVVGLIVLAVIALIIADRVRGKRAGRSSCGDDCAHCGMCGNAGKRGHEK